MCLCLPLEQLTLIFSLHNQQPYKTLLVKQLFPKKLETKEISACEVGIVVQQQEITDRRWKKLQHEDDWARGLTAE